MIDLHVKISGRINRIRTALKVGMTPEDGQIMINSFEQGIIGSGNYLHEWRRMQSEWRPLKPEYVQEKLEAGYPSQIWILTGATLRALTTPATITGRFWAGGTGRAVHVVTNRGYFVEVGWRITPPAASGWPDRRPAVLQTEFSRLNVRRPFIQNISEQAKRGTQELLDKVISDYFRRVFGK